LQWLQLNQRFPWGQINVLIKDTGNDTGNITAAMKAVVQKGWVEIVAKDGDIQQSRNRYKITNAGATKAREMLFDSTSKRKRSKVVLSTMNG
jgi:DNA-binding MarR family transcriptional regulator